MAADEVLYRFPGVFSFEDNDLSSELFCGREEDGYKLLQYILSEHLTILFGTSGYGKTSILQAYVFRKLRENFYYPVIIRLNIADKSPQEIIKARFREIKKQSNFEYNEQNNAGDLKSFFNAIEIWSEDIKLLTPVIVFDQFEEMFTLEHNNKYRESFFEELATVINACREGNLSIKIVISIREDMVGKLEKMAYLIPSIFTNRFLLKPLTRESAGRAITEPAEKKLIHKNGAAITPPFYFSAEAKEELLNFLGRKKEEGKWKQSNEIAPIQLQIICRELEEKAYDKAKKINCKEPVWVHAKDLQGEEEKIENGLQRILAGFYGKQILKLRTELNLNEAEILAIRNAIECHLIAGKKRVPVDYDALISWPGIRKDGIDLLVLNRLLKKEEYGENSLIEISHDTLIEPILESYELRRSAEEAAANLEKANRLYERLLLLSKETFALSAEEMKELEILIEEKLIEGNNRKPINYKTVLESPNIRKEVIDLFVKEELLSLETNNCIEIKSDIYLDSILKKRQIRRSEEERLNKEIELINQKLKIQSDKKRVKRNVIWVVCTLAIITGVCAFMYSRNIRDKNDIITQMGMLFKGNEYLGKGDLSKAFGIFTTLNEKKNKAIISQINKTEINYTDLPGVSVKTLSNNHILSVIDDSNFQIWKINSANSIKLDKTYNNFKYVDFSNDDAYIALYIKSKLILYISKTNSEITLLSNTAADTDPYFTFSENGNYFSYYNENKLHVINLKNNYQRSEYKWQEGYQFLMKTLVYASDNNLFTYSANNIYGWRKNAKDSLVLDTPMPTSVTDSRWAYIDKGAIVYCTNNELSIYSLITRQKTVAVKEDFIKNTYLLKPSPDLIFLYARDFSNHLYNDVYYNLVFYNTKDKRIHRPFKNDKVRKFSINADYTKCLVRDMNQNVFLIDNDGMKREPVPFLKDAAAYDISDDGKNILYVKVKKDEKGSLGEKKEQNTLYMYSLVTNRTDSIDNIYSDPNSKDSTTIYSKYFFRFSADSRMFAYIKEKKELTNAQQKKDSTFFIVKDVSNKKMVFNSSKIEQFVDAQKKNDFTSFYIHVKSKGGREGIVLLNSKPRNAKYFSALYGKMNDKDWNEEVNNLKLNY